MTTKKNTYKPMTRKAFENLSLPAQRVRIAKDVIAALDSKRLVARNGTYLEFAGGKSVRKTLMKKVFGNRVGSYAEVDAKEILEKSPKCHVCALGSVFVACVETIDKLPITVSKESYSLSISADQAMETSLEENMSDDYLMRDYLSAIFDTNQLHMIESAFEAFDENIIDFVKSKWSSDKRLRAVMQNVIDNEGTFIPPGPIDPNEVRNDVFSDEENLKSLKYPKKHWGKITKPVEEPKP